MAEAGPPLAVAAAIRWTQMQHEGRLLNWTLQLHACRRAQVLELIPAGMPASCPACSELAPLDFNVRSELQQMAAGAFLSYDTFNNTIIEVCSFHAVSITCPQPTIDARVQHCDLQSVYVCWTCLAQACLPWVHRSACTRWMLRWHSRCLQPQLSTAVGGCKTFQNPRSRPERIYLQEILTIRWPAPAGAGPHGRGWPGRYQEPHRWAAATQCTSSSGLC